jgi:hypothetical protein
MFKHHGFHGATLPDAGKAVMLPAMQMSVVLTATLTGLLLTACSSCKLCYEDEWSRTPFPGQKTQTLPPLPDPAR